MDVSRALIVADEPSGSISGTWLAMRAAYRRRDGEH